jgi:hypothetical protein
MHSIASFLLCTLAGLVAPALLDAQIDYRNLDDGRPVRAQDAYPIERYAFELVVPYELEQEEGADLHLVAPELGYGIARNAQLEVELPFAAVRSGGSTEWGFAGPRVGLLYNLNTDGPVLPAFSLGGRLALPLGDLAPDDPRLTLLGVATRSWGRTRLHLNAAATLGEAAAAAVAADPDWSVSAAADRTLLRQSLLLIGELSAQGPGDGDPTEVSVALGARMQLTPTLVADAGVTRRLTADSGPDLGMSLGLSYIFGVAALMPRGGR